MRPVTFSRCGFLADGLCRGGVFDERVCGVRVRVLVHCYGVHGNYFRHALVVISKPSTGLGVIVSFQRS